MIDVGLDTRSTSRTSTYAERGDLPTTLHIRFLISAFVSCRVSLLSREYVPPGPRPLAAPGYRVRALPRGRRTEDQVPVPVPVHNEAMLVELREANAP